MVAVDPNTMVGFADTASRRLTKHAPCPLGSQFTPSFVVANSSVWDVPVANTNRAVAQCAPSIFNWTMSPVVSSVPET